MNLPPPSDNYAQPVTPQPLAPIPPPDHVVHPASAPLPAPSPHASASTGSPPPPEPDDFIAHAPYPDSGFSANDKLPDLKERNHFVQKLSAAGVAILVHVALALLLFTVYVVIPRPKSAEITAISAPTSQDPTPETKKVVEQPPQPQVSQATTSARLMTAVGASSVPLPTVDFEPTTESVDLGTMIGSFDANFGGATMGTVSFMGNASQARRVVFAVDASKSMNSKGKGKKKNTISKFDLMKQELDDSIRKLPEGTQYQILFFSAFAWPHDEIDAGDDKKEWKDYKWTIRPGDDNPKTPDFKYRDGTKDNIKESRELIKDLEMTLGTNWGPPVLMALGIRPKPDVVFFMTDGTTGNPKVWIEMINSANRKGGKRATIHTTAMMEPDAAEDLNDLAEKNNGTFTIINADGSITKGEEFFKK